MGVGTSCHTKRSDFRYKQYPWKFSTYVTGPLSFFGGVYKKKKIIQNDNFWEFLIIPFQKIMFTKKSVELKVFDYLTNSNKDLDEVFRTIFP